MSPSYETFEEQVLGELGSINMAIPNKRFLAACAAMQGMISQGAMSVASITIAAVEFADALLKELDK